MRSISAVLVILAMLAGSAVRPAQAQTMTPSAPDAQGEEISISVTDETPAGRSAPKQIDLSSPSTDQAAPSTQPPDQQPPPPPSQIPPPPQGSSAPQYPAAQPVPSDPPVQDVSTAAFQEDLSPYGAWVTVDGLGRVWRPYPGVVGVGFTPYMTGGHWEYTEYGWTWVSDFDWGWITFHYGRWWLDPYYGWVWYPGDVWGPAWVTWQYGGGYVGWAPMTPMGWVFGEAVWALSWCFVDTPHFVSINVGNYAVPPARVTAVYSVTTRQGRGGPPVENVAHEANVSIRRSSIARTRVVPPNHAAPFAPNHVLLSNAPHVPLRGGAGVQQSWGSTSGTSRPSPTEPVNRPPSVPINRPPPSQGSGYGYPHSAAPAPTYNTRPTYTPPRQYTTAPSRPAPAAPHPTAAPAASYHPQSHPSGSGGKR
jgi:hypothetical protein